jgi:signal transduction histidine kinase
MLRTRLYLGLLPLLAAAIAMGVGAVVVCRRLAGEVQGDLVASYQSSLACERMRADANRMANAVGVGADTDPMAAGRELRAAEAAFNRDLLGLSTGAAGTPRAPLVEAIDSAFRALSAEDEGVLAAGGGGSLATAQQSADVLFRASSAIEALERHDYAEAEATAARARRLAADTARGVGVAIAGALLLSLASAWFLAASFLRPIRALTTAAVAVGEGNLDLPVPEFSRDELGRLARTFNAMAGKLRAYREATAARVLRAQRTMEATLASAPDPVFVVARGGATEVRNRAAEQLAASSDCGPGVPAALAGPLAEVLATGRHYLPTDYARAVTLRVEREERHFLPRILAIGDQLTEFSGAAVILQDVTRFRLLDDAKTNLFGTVSHELKTPLTSLRLALYLLLEEKIGSLAPAQRELLETARNEADRLLRIITDLLDLARLESGEAALSRREVAVADLLADAAREAPSRLAPGQRLVVRCAEGVGTVLADTDRLRHVFLNFLTNAAKYGDPDGTVTLYAEPAPIGQVRCGVRDQGPGIAPEAVPRIFDRFYRVPGSPKTGAGLGLAIAREIVAAHGGTIGCASRLEEGSDFYFELPGNSRPPSASMGMKPPAQPEVRHE